MGLGPVVRPLLGSKRIRTHSGEKKKSPHQTALPNPAWHQSPGGQAPAGLGRPSPPSLLPSGIPLERCPASPGMVPGAQEHLVGRTVRPEAPGAPDNLPRGGEGPRCSADQCGQGGPWVLALMEQESGLEVLGRGRGRLGHCTRKAGGPQRTLGVAAILTAGSWLRRVRLPSQEAAESSTPPSQLLGPPPSCPQPAAPPNRAPPPPAWTTVSCCLTEQAEVTGGRGLSSEHLGRSRWAVPTMTWPPHHPFYRWGSPPSFLAFLCICFWTFTHGGDFPTSLQLPRHPHIAGHSAAPPGLPSSLTLSWGPWAHSRPPAPGPPPHWVLMSASGPSISLASQATNPNREPWSAAPLSRRLPTPPHSHPLHLMT